MPSRREPHRESPSPSEPAPPWLPPTDAMTPYPLFRLPRSWSRRRSSRPLAGSPPTPLLPCARSLPLGAAAPPAALPDRSRSAAPLPDSRTPPPPPPVRALSSLRPRSGPVGADESLSCSTILPRGPPQLPRLGFLPPPPLPIGTRFRAGVGGRLAAGGPMVPDTVPPPRPAAAFALAFAFAFLVAVAVAAPSVDWL